MLKSFLGFAAFAIALPSLAAAPTYEIVTIQGKVVQVDGSALSDAYKKMVDSTENQVSKNENGSTSIVLPTTMIGGVSYSVAFAGSNPLNYAQGLCKIRGFSKAEAYEEGPVADRSVMFNPDTTIYAIYGQRYSNIYAYHTVVCR